MDSADKVPGERPRRVELAEDLPIRLEALARAGFLKPEEVRQMLLRLEARRAEPDQEPVG